MSAVTKFTKQAFAVIEDADAGFFAEFLESYGDPAIIRCLHELDFTMDFSAPVFDKNGFKAIFERSVVFDNPGRSPLISSLIYEATQPQDFNHWVIDGGSPMISTELKSNDVETVQILGFEESLFSSCPAFFSIASFSNPPIEQWLLGTTPAMIASSILRSIGKGQFNPISIQRIVPEELFDVFKDPQVGVQLTEYLANQPKLGEKESFIGSPSNFGDIAYLLMKYGADEQLKAMAKSAAGAALVDNPDEVYSQIISCECNQSRPDLRALETRISLVFGKNDSSPAFDCGIAKLFMISSKIVRASLADLCVVRMVELAEAGKLHLAVGWIHQIIDENPAIREFDEIARENFRGAYHSQPETDKKLMTKLNMAHRLRFIISALGSDVFVKEFCSELTVARAASSFPNTKVLKEFGLINPLLKQLESTWLDLWANSANKIHENRVNNRLQKLVIKRHLEGIANWLGKLVGIEQDSELAHDWYDRLKHPFLQLPFVDAMPFDQSLRQRMTLNTQGKQFLRDLGM